MRRHTSDGKFSSAVINYAGNLIFFAWLWFAYMQDDSPKQPANGISLYNSNFHSLAARLTKSACSIWMRKSERLVLFLLCPIGYRLHNIEKTLLLYRDSLFTCYFLWVWNDMLWVIKTQWSYNNLSALINTSTLNSLHHQGISVFTLINMCLPILYLHYRFSRFFSILFAFSGVFFNLI
jgi:hypothetical protein